MWSLNEHIDNTINALLFLLAINFLHIGQFLLPIICLIIFIDNKFKFKVNSILLFALLCLFGITFFAFSYKTGFYSTMGFCLPMAYYIGSNLIKTDEKSIKNIIYILTFGMACHVVLNFVFEIFIDGADLFNSISHYDVWTGGYISTTSTATNAIFLISLIYYLLFKEKDKTIKIIGISLFVLIAFYNFALGRRTPILLTAICMIVSLIVDMFFGKTNKSIIKNLVRILVIIVAVLLLIIFIYQFNILNFREVINNLGLIKKFADYGLQVGRIDIFFKAIKLLPSHLWGNREIFNILGIQIHDLWFDTFDYAGIIPFVLMVIRSLLALRTLIHLFRNKNISSDFKTFIFALFFAITIQLFLEPIMSGSSLFIIIVVLIEALLENRLVNENK